MNQSQSKRSILEARLQQMYYLQKSIDFYQTLSTPKSSHEFIRTSTPISEAQCSHVLKILELQKIVYEFRIILIQYITRFDTHSIELSHRHINIQQKRIPCHQIINKMQELLQLIEMEFHNNVEYTVMCKKIPEYMEKLRILENSGALSGIVRLNDTVEK